MHGKLDFNSRDETSPPRPISNTSRVANDNRNLQPHDEHDYGHSDDQDIRTFNSRKRRRTTLENDIHTTDDIVTSDQVRHSQSLPPEKSTSLRRSSRGTALTSGPQAYSKRWHPIDDLKTAKKAGIKSSREKVKIPNLKDTKNPTSLAREDRNELLEIEDSRKYQFSADHDESSKDFSRRRSPRHVYDAEIAMRYDTSHHWSYDNWTGPKVFAKKLEEKRRSIALTLHREGKSYIPLSQPLWPPSDLPKFVKHRNHLSQSSRIAVDAKSKAREDETSKSTLSENDLDTEQQNSKISPRTLPAVVSPSADSPMILDEHPVLHEQDFNVIPAIIAPAITQSKPWPDNQFVRPLPIRQSQKVHPQPLDWNNLTEFDQRLFSLQKGAPVDGATLPLQWQAVKKTLIEEGFRNVVLQQDNDQETNCIKNRYESIRLSIEAFYQAKPEPECNKDWILFHAEGFNIYDYKKARKYWKRSAGNIVKPTETSTEYKFTCPQSPVLISDKQAEENPFAREPYLADDVRTQDISTTDTQLDRFLALAEPPEEVESLPPVTTSIQDLVSSKTMCDSPEHISADAVYDDQATHSQSEKTLMDVMGVTRPPSPYANSQINVAGIEDSFEGFRSIRNICSKPSSTTLKRITKTRSPIKRGKRNKTPDFTIHEDDIAGAKAAISDGESPLYKGRLPRGLDLPVENMSTGELVPTAHEAAPSLASTRGRYQLGTILGEPSIPPTWAAEGDYLSILSGALS